MNTTPENTVQITVEFFDKLLQKYHTPAAQQRAQAIPS